MPGFVIGGQGGPGPANTVETRRKHRWVFETIGSQFQQPILLLLKEASRPHPVFEEPELHHNQEKAYFAGKYGWEAISLVWYDGEQPDVSASVYAWLESILSVNAVTVNPPSAYKKEATLQMLNGAGAPTETWNLYGCWPQDINWNTLDYADTEIQTIEATMRIDRATRG